MQQRTEILAAFFFRLRQPSRPPTPAIPLIRSGRAPGRGTTLGAHSVARSRKVRKLESVSFRVKHHRPEESADMGHKGHEIMTNRRDSQCGAAEAAQIGSGAICTAEEGQMVVGVG